jgi:hypothetical protein
MGFRLVARFSRKEYTDLYIYCTNEFIYSAKATKLTIKSALGSLSWYDERNQREYPARKYSVSSDLTGGNFTVTKGFRRSKTRANTLSFNYKILLTGGSCYRRHGSDNNNDNTKKKRYGRSINRAKFRLSKGFIVISGKRQLIYGNNISLKRT